MSEVTSPVHAKEQKLPEMACLESQASPIASESGDFDFGDGQEPLEQSQRNEESLTGTKTETESV